MQGQFFSWLEEKGNEMRLNRFGYAMTGTAGWEDGGGVSQAGGGGVPDLDANYSQLILLQGFNWAGLAEGSLVVDVGGGIGSTSMALAKAFPHLRFCIQDRPKTVELGIAVSNPPSRTSSRSLKTPRRGESGVLRCWNPGGR